MTGKRKVVTTEVLETDAPEAPAVEEEFTPDQSELMEYMGFVGDSANMIKIKKLVDGVINYCGRTAPGLLNEDAIIRKWGGGEYILEAFNNNHWVKGGRRTIHLLQPLEDALKIPESQIPNTSKTDEVSILQQQINRQQEMIMQFIQAGGQRDNISMPEILGMVRDMQAMTPKPPDLMAILPTIVTLFKDTMEVARETAGGGDDKMSWLKVISGAIEKVPVLFGQLAAARMGGGAAAHAGNGGNPSPGSNPAIELTPEHALVLQGLAWLKKKAKSGKSFEATADMLADNMDDEMFGPVAVGILNAPFEEILKFDPEIAKEPVRTWFFSLYTELRKVMAIQNENTIVIAGEGGGTPDAPGNEKVND